jgi:hypothetical protein
LDGADGEVHRLPHVESDSEAHLAASAYMIDRVDELWAVMKRSALLTSSELPVADADHQMGLPERLVRRQRHVGPDDRRKRSDEEEQGTDPVLTR